ncbi:hypothetical protein FB45DRAFT_929501 [Roridomyces roridus]|uniref:JmjC domain-containing protein n=1 Tax=Roridomyces roridus TaxID=1738132 RepID=A0AAD7BGB8_9AGAR|nr:hypothetical protein FB45DRAFT_929501 [Roridomyces roridus]
MAPNIVIERQLLPRVDYHEESLTDCVTCAHIRLNGCKEFEDPEDDCRFQLLRHLCRDGEGLLNGVFFPGPETAEEVRFDWPECWSTPLDADHRNVLKKAVATALLPILLKEQRRISTNSAMIHRPRETVVRVTCDRCSTSIFPGSWMCRCCGQEVCEECVEEIREPARNIPHPANEDFVPVTRFTPEELNGAILRMSALVDPADGVVAPTADDRELRKFLPAELTEDIFQQMMTHGHPLLVTKVALRWEPKDLKASGICDVIDCQSGIKECMSAAEFFGGFGQYRQGRPIWKVKDWPPSTDFHKQFPILYEQFDSAVPMPDYVRRDGILNLAAYFPSNTVAPDLGPKMYSSYANRTEHNCRGTTQLHLDMSDAVNIMVFASPDPGNKPGSAVWDIFRGQDTDKIRQYLQDKGDFAGDPIHDQDTYLSEDDRRDLQDKCGVRGYRVVQKPGDAIFIPAGCAHQVCNLSDCIKVAIDFVSPESIIRCQGLARELRREGTRKEDKLQLHSLLWFTWLYYCREEES